MCNKKHQLQKEAAACQGTVTCRSCRTSRRLQARVPAFGAGQLADGRPPQHPEGGSALPSGRPLVSLPHPYCRICTSSCFTCSVREARSATLPTPGAAGPPRARCLLGSLREDASLSGLAQPSADMRLCWSRPASPCRAACFGLPGPPDVLPGTLRPAQEMQASKRAMKHTSKPWNRFPRAA